MWSFPSIHPFQALFFFTFRLYLCRYMDGHELLLILLTPRRYLWHTQILHPFSIRPEAGIIPPQQKQNKKIKLIFIF
jgi:hypothetical protein